MDKSAENVALGKRLRAFRENAKIPRSLFALVIGFGSERLASYEAGRAPLPYIVFIEIASHFPINPTWLASGTGDMDWGIRLAFPEPEELGEPANAKFIDVFNKHIAPTLEKLYPTISSEVLTRRTYAKICCDPIESLFMSAPKKELDTLQGRIFSILRDFVDEIDRDDPKATLKRWIAFEQSKNEEYKAIAKEIIESMKGGGNKDLTHLTTPEIIGGVNHWHRLKTQIQKATGNPGSKSMLAKVLGVDLTQISRWLSKTGPEPGADYTLKMLQWVQERESKQ